MKVELLYPELTNLLGENGSQLLLARTFGEENTLRTPYPSRPSFLDNDISLVVMGAMTEAKQKLILELLLPFKEDIRKKIEEGQFFLFTGNALDLLGKKIIHEDGETLEGLELFDFETFVNKYDRINKFVHGYSLEGSEIFGWISQFTSYQGQMPFFIRAKEANYGLHYKNLYATSLLGPLLITSPEFTRELLLKIGLDKKLPLEEEIFETFNKRKQDMSKNASK